MHTLGVLVTVAVLAALVVIFGGFADVAATSGHSAPVRWLLETALENRIEREASKIQAPALPDARAARGAAAYADMCEVCHGAPGAKQTVLAKGLLPEPPALTEEAEEWSAAELFWIVKHGIKFTGMPAWGPTHTDEELWDIVAFVERLPKLSAEEYERLTQEAPAGAHDHSHAPGAPPHAH